jgi:hypothetical protein
MFSVNPSPKESQLVFLESPEAIKTWRFNRPAEAGRAPVSPARAQVRLAGILQQRLWWWMVVAGLLALLLEMMLAEARRERT